MEHIQLSAKKLLTASLSYNSRLSYRTALRSFENFCNLYSLSQNAELTIRNIILFIAYCAEKGFSSKTVMTYMYGLNFFQKLYGLPSLFESFLINKLLEGYKRTGHHKDSRAPITQELLANICNALPHICKSDYESTLFKAVFSLAYFGLFRVSEIVFSHQEQIDNPLQLEDLLFDKLNKAVIVCLRRSKTSRTPVSLRIPCDMNENICCVRALQKYVHIRPKGQGFLFVHADCSPLTRYQFSAILAKVIRFLQLPEGKFKTHSFRIGRATDLSVMGVPNNAIQQMGRWQSVAFQSYIRA